MFLGYIVIGSRGNAFGVFLEYADAEEYRNGTMPDAKILTLLSTED